MTYACIWAFFNAETDADILDHLSRASSVSGYLKALVRYDIQHGLISGLPKRSNRRCVTRRGEPSAVVRKPIALNTESDADVLARLKAAPSVGSYLRELIRMDMRRRFIDIVKIPRKESPTEKEG